MAFLRAINTPGRQVKMDRLKTAFTCLPFTNVDTFIASGNVIFDVIAPPRADEIEAVLEAELGFATPVYLRTADEVISVADLRPFGDSEGQVEVSFLQALPDPGAVEELLATVSGRDQLAVVGAEVYWLLSGPRNESAHKESMVVKILDMATTRRSIRTVRRIADKYLRSSADPARTQGSGAPI